MQERNTGSILGLRVSPGEVNGNPLQYSCLGNPMGKGAWWGMVLAVTQLDTTEQLNTQLQYSCLQNPMDGGAWWAAVHGVAKSDTTERLHFRFSLSCIGEGNGNPLQCSCLENPRDGGPWWAAVYGVVQSRTRLKRLSSSSSRADSFTLPCLS